MVWFIEGIKGQNFDIKILDEQELKCDKPPKLNGQLIRNVTTYDVCPKGWVM